MLATASYGCSHTYKLGSLSQPAVQDHVRELADTHELRTEVSPGLWVAVTILPGTSIVRPLPRAPGVTTDEAPILQSDRFDNRNISFLKFDDKAKGALEGLTMGLLAGGVGAGTLGYINYQSRPDPPPFGGCVEFCGASGVALTTAKYAAYGALVGGLVGAAIGALVGDRSTVLLDR